MCPSSSQLQTTSEIILLKVTSLDGSVLEVEATGLWTGLDLCKNILKAKPVSSGCTYQLLFGNDVLSLSETLSQSGMTDGATVYTVAIPDKIAALVEQCKCCNKAKSGMGEIEAAIQLKTQGEKAVPYAMEISELVQQASTGPALAFHLMQTLELMGPIGQAELSKFQDDLRPAIRGMAKRALKISDLGDGKTGERHGNKELETRKTLQRCWL